MKNTTVWIGNDHGGYALKKKVIAYFREKGVKFRNIGSDSEAIVRYPYYAARIAEAISRGRAERGILICSTGIGMSIIANRFPNVRASCCTSTFMAKMTRKHNDSNVLCLGGKITGEFEAFDIVETWLKTGFIGGRHKISLDLIREAEKSLCNNGSFKFTGKKR